MPYLFQGKKNPYKWREYLTKETATILSQSHNDEEIAEARADLGAFGRYVLEKAPAKHHRTWIEYLVTEEDSACLRRIGGNNLSILAPRGSAKSTWVALFVAWSIGVNPGIQIIYSSYSESVALSRSRIVKRIIQSERYRTVFPWVVPSKRWADTDWEIDRELAGVDSISSDYTFYASGITGAIVSRRSSLIVLDDIIKSSASISNPEIRERIRTNFSEVIVPTLIPGGRIVSIGTRFRPDDIHATTFCGEGWEQVVQPAIVTDPASGKEESYWPEWVSLNELQKKRQTDLVTFQFQYQNRIIRISTISVDPDWIKYGEVPSRFDSLALGVDLASSLKEKADYSAFVLCGRKNGLYYILDYQYGKWTGNLEKLDVIADFLEDWSAFRVMVESTKYQASLKGDFEDYLINEKGLYELSCTAVKPKGDKLERLRGFFGLFENGKIVFNQYRDFSPLIDQLINAGSTRHDDISDAMTYGLMGVSGRRSLESA